ncbi:replication factor C subunit 5 (macronuclear) [Tetrahymena thermophila SB210]|uniref:Replication factor C subunit 5 n=1 Tax=Tetrahymena thermophila (strain SB210) TaxID=312017 RepID=Q22N75_TETTS|nr:replication factor C subunit 5 [Tetrahymena thermophila SB210]EAR86910.2 replication factor C subunit 5 [Tetrahymena thermophila SB210]|eukprot:XP_001007155.2 replication factor C subunit 5 [Tetrahymena thermophila SB210]
MEEEIPITVETKQKQQNIPWVEKYRPENLDNVISHEYIVATIKKFIEEDKKLPNLLFYGPPGTGKTSLIVALAKQLYGKNYKQLVLELNASDDRGIDVVREQIKTFASTANFGMVGKGTKLIILDEADSMTNQAQFALRRIIEKYSSNARFCMICNYVSKIIPALQSRCTRFKFKHIPYQDAKLRIAQICNAENLKYKNSGIEAVFKLCDGDMRRVVNMLQSLSLQGYGSDEQVEITDELVYKFTGNATPKDIENIINTMNNKSISESYEIIQSYQVEKGISLQVMLKEISLFLMNTSYPSLALEFLVKRLADLEYRMSINCDEKVQTLSLISAFTEVRQLLRRP